MLARVTHTENGTTHECLGISALVWCPGCNKAHRFVFRCPEHGGPSGVCWEGDPYADLPDWPPTNTSSNSLMTRWVNDERQTVQCHSFVKNGQWEFLDDCTAHDLRGFHPMVDLPDWLTD